MKKVLLIIVVLLTLLSIFTYYNNNNPKIIIYQLVKKGDINLEELVYRVNLFGIIPVAKAVFKIGSTEKYDAGEVYHLNASASPLRLYSKLFKGYAVLDSYVDTGTFNPILFKQKIVIPEKGVMDKEVSYDQQNGIMAIAGIRRQILPNTQDPLSLIFNLRRINLDNIKDLQMNINTNQKNYIFEAKIEHKQISINKNIYKLALVKSTIHRRDKNPYHKSNVNIILLEGEQNIPILIKIFASGFYINAKLVSMK